jgi:hypothetical protein
MTKRVEFCLERGNGLGNCRSPIGTTTDHVAHDWQKSSEPGTLSTRSLVRELVSWRCPRATFPNASAFFANLTCQEHDGQRNFHVMGGYPSLTLTVLDEHISVNPGRVLSLSPRNILNRVVNELEGFDLPRPWFPQREVAEDDHRGCRVLGGAQAFILVNELTGQATNRVEDLSLMKANTCTDLNEFVDC